MCKRKAGSLKFKDQALMLVSPRCVHLSSSTPPYTPIVCIVCMQPFAHVQSGGRTCTRMYACTDIRTCTWDTLTS